MTTNRSDEWQEGNAAYWNGDMDCDNSYPVGSDQAMDWEDGYRNAEDSDV